MPTLPPGVAHLQEAAEHERQRYRELTSVIAERLRAHVEAGGRLPTVLIEIVGAGALQAMIATSGRLQAIDTAIDAADQYPMKAR